MPIPSGSRTCGGIMQPIAHRIVRPWLMLVALAYSGLTLAGSDLHDNGVTLLAATSTPAKVTDVVEFYEAELDHYFITLEGDEARMIDTGAVGNWVRTGESFPAYANVAD